MRRTGEIDDEFPVVTTGKVYRLRKLYFIVMLACIPFFLALALFCTVAWLCNFGQEVELAVVLAAVWWFATFFCVWVVLAYFRERLYVETQWMRQIGVLRTRTMRIEDVLNATWKRFLGGSLVLRGHEGKITVAFNNFVARDRFELIDFFRIALEERIQEGWPAFEACLCATRERKPMQDVWTALLSFGVAVYFGYCGRIIAVVVAVLFGFWSLVGAWRSKREGGKEAANNDATAR